MPLTVYINSSDKKVIGKSLSQVAVINYILLDECNIINPKMRIKYASNILTSNYAYIAEFNRYYFIDNITIINGKEIIIELSIDVLETYKVQIKALTCIVKRNTNVFNKYLDDTYFQALNKKQVITQVISSSTFHPYSLAGNPCFLLTVARGS